ncbi:MAG: putative Tubulin gamma-2 chain, partial [Streblomastix strix]
VRNCSSLEGFIITHSPAGGTGSGLGSYIMEHLSNEYPTKVVDSFSIFPGADSDVVVQSYNQILTLQRLTECAHIVVPIVNSALFQIAKTRLKIESPKNEDINTFIATVMGLATSTLRFPGYTHNSLEGIAASLVPFPGCNLITSSCTPLAPAQTLLTNVRSTTISDVMERLLMPDNKLISYQTSSLLGTQQRQQISGCYVSALDILRTKINYKIDHDYISNYLPIIKRKLNFASWSPPALEIAFTNEPIISNKRSGNEWVRLGCNVQGLMLANHTGIATLLNMIRGDFLKQFQMGANMHIFKETGLLHNEPEAEFQHASEVTKGVIDEYKAMNKANFVEWEPEQWGWVGFEQLLLSLNKIFGLHMWNQTFRRLKPGYLEDCRNLIILFGQKGDFSFAAFRAVWVDMKFTNIHEAKAEDVEDDDFLQELYRIFIDFLFIQNQPSYVRVGAIFGLYALYNSRKKDKIKIKIDDAVMFELQKIQQEFIQSQYIDAFFALREMRVVQRAFAYTALMFSPGPPYTRVDEEVSFSVPAEWIATNGIDNTINFWDLQAQSANYQHAKKLCLQQTE